jgi:hypothetical protein
MISTILATTYRSKGKKKQKISQENKNYQFTIETVSTNTTEANKSEKEKKTKLIKRQYHKVDKRKR